MSQTVRKLLGKLSKEKATRKQYYVSGSGLVSVPEGRLGEIKGVVEEHHKLELQRARLAASARRAY